MARLTPNATYTMNGVKVNEKIIPDGTRWKSASKAVAAKFSANSLYKRNEKLSCNTGRVQSVTIHNTNDLANVHDDAEQYTRATYNENMNSSRVHFYVDDVGAWQNLKAGTGLTPADPEGCAEVSWHSGDGSIADGGNMTSISFEIIMGQNSVADAKAYDNGARMAAWILWKHGLTVANLVTHTYWVNKSAGKKFADVDKQCTNLIPGKKWCPSYIFNSYNATTAYNNWMKFKNTVKGYLDALNGTKNESTTTKPTTNTTTPTTNNTTSNNTLKFKKGDIVMFMGTKHYSNANATSGPSCKPGKARVSATPRAGYKHPYHLIAISGGGSNVYGWVDSADVIAIETVKSAPVKDYNAAAKDVIKGKYGNGDARNANLKAAGFTDAEISKIQGIVNSYYA